MFDYIYSDSKRKFSFIKLPSVLFTDERFSALTNDMKLLYALMLDRVSLSVKNGWVDSKGRVYISFPLAEIEEKLHVASQKASRLLKALEKAGLIERVRQGEMPRSFDTLPRVGQGAYEIRINIGTAWRVIYVANRKEAVYVLHCFQKKTRATSQKDIDLAARRYRRIGKG